MSMINYEHEKKTPQGLFCISDVSKPRERNPSGAALEETKDMIQKVLETRPHGIPVSDFSAVFQVLTIFYPFHHHSQLLSSADQEFR